MYTPKYHALTDIATMHSHIAEHPWVHGSVQPKTSSSRITSRSFSMRSTSPTVVCSATCRHRRGHDGPLALQNRPLAWQLQAGGRSTLARLRPLTPLPTIAKTNADSTANARARRGHCTRRP